jgi:transcriptional antiterminator NusG
VRTGSEERIIEQLQKKADFKPFVLKREFIFRRKGVKSTFEKLCFPGYVFVESKLPPTDFIEVINPLIRRIEGFYRLLNYGNGVEVAIREEERRVLATLFGDEHCIDVPQVLRVGDSVTVVSGVLRGHESRIIRIDRDKIVISVELFGKSIEVTVGVEIVKKVI